MGCYCLMCTEFQSGKKKIFWSWVEMMVINNINLLNASELYILKHRIVHFMLCIFLLSKF